MKIFAVWLIGMDKQLPNICESIINHYQTQTQASRLQTHVNHISIDTDAKEFTEKTGVASLISMLCGCKLFACSYFLGLTLHILQV